MNVLYLNKWKIKPAAGSESLIPANISFTDDADAAIPGDIYMHLIEAGLIADPFYADNELKLAWIPQIDWEYTTDFNIEKQSDFDKLVFEGLDTIAELYFNDTLIGRTENMFVRHLFDIKKYLRLGKNIVRIILQSPLKKAAENKTDIRQLPSARHKDRVFIRKAQYSFGWDWGPAFPSSGIWKEVYLKKSHPEIDHIAFETIAIKNTKATIRINVFLNNNHDEDLVLTIRLFNNDQNFEKTLPVSEKNEIVTVFELENARLWWPHDQGKPHLYDLEISLINLAEQKISHYQKKVGIRIVKLGLKEKDQDQTQAFRLLPALGDR